MSKPQIVESARWRLEDLITLKCALVLDKQEDWTVLKERDAAIMEDKAILSGKNRRQVLLNWLHHRKRNDPVIRQAAESTGHFLQITEQVLCALALLVGIAAATATLAYNGQSPINVSVFFCVFILFQLILAIGLLSAFLLPRGLRESLAFGPLFRALKRAMEFVLERIQTAAYRILSGAQRGSVASLAGEASRTLSLHGSVYKWLVFGKLQSAALFFNSGALCTLLFAVIFSDRAFGWQTTLQVTGETVHFLAGLIALPWSWIYGEGLGFPSLSQVEGSRIVLKDGIQTLSTSDLVSWWRFLALGILFYGILPRIIILFLGKWQLRKQLAALDFMDAESEQLMRRLTPARAGFVSQAVDQEEVTVTDPAAVSTGDHPSAGSVGMMRCLLTRELADSLDQDALRATLARLWSRPEQCIVLVVQDSSKAAHLNEPGPGEQLAVIHEGWIPPIKEHERQLKALRREVPKNTLIRLVILGIPGEDGKTISLETSGHYLVPWEALVRRCADPYLFLENSSL